MNLHALQRKNLNLVRLPIPPHPRIENEPRGGDFCKVTLLIIANLSIKCKSFPKEILTFYSDFNIIIKLYTCFDSNRRSV